jgi:ATP-binding cassette subfamily C (CFTR/MRP) protein 1
MAHVTTSLVSLYSSTPLLVALATFAAYTLSGHDLDVAEALTALSLFDILRFPLFMLPQIINRIVEAGISFERVREFLLCEEYKSVGEGQLKENGEVLMKNMTCVYDSKKVRVSFYFCFHGCCAIEF